ncbi:sedoheptulokinase-like isoform X2 [Babylonia areolata]
MNMDPFIQPYTLGIDLGTTSIKVAIVDAVGRVVENVTVPSLASVPSSAGEERQEQCPFTIWSALQAGLRQLDPDNQVKVQAIGVSGQMHGLLLWQGSKSWQSIDDQTRHIKLRNLSHLYTWQDQRCSQQFLSSLPKPDSSLRVASGYGCVTLLWLLQNEQCYLEKEQFTCAGTVMDFVVAAICDLERPVTSDQLAASFGYYSVPSRSWNIDILKSCGFPVEVLPEVRQAGQVAGHLQQGLEHIPAGTPVLVALGDMQCSVLAALQRPSDAMLNISTSIQLSVQVDDDAQSDTQLGEAVEVVPYFGSTRLAVVAGLNGGNVLTSFIKLLKRWLEELGFLGNMLDSAFFEKLLRLGQESPEDSTLRMSPTLFGERHDPDLQASLTGISAHNATLGALFRAASEGIVDNILRLLPPEVLVARGVKRIVGSGSVLAQNPLVLRRLQQRLAASEEMEFVQGSESDAAFGAAKAALAFLKV